MENLGKENFWNAIEEKYPEAFEYFSKWIDDYKNEVNWNALFGNNIEHLTAPLIKFHDLPFEMQNGIIARFELELFNNRRGAGKAEYKAIAEQYKSAIRNLFADVQRGIIEVQKKKN